MLICGIDEAGRGCVIGPLVIGIVCCDEAGERALVSFGVRDSKLLSPGARSRLYEKINSLCTAKIVRTTARELNELMKKHSLNEIEAMKIGEALSELMQAPERIFVDSPDPTPKKFEKRIRRYYKGGAKIVSENKADAKYPVVSAASIVAKVERDAEVELIKKELGFDFNSGYTSDQVTIDFLKKNIHRSDVRKYIRKEWQTVERLKQRKLDEY